MSWPSNFDWFIFRSVISINLRKIDVCCTKIFDVFPLVDMMLQLQSSAPYNLPNLCERGRKFHTQLNNNRCNRSCPCSSSCVYIRWLVERETLTPESRQWKQSNAEAATPCSCKSPVKESFFFFFFLKVEQTWALPELLFRVTVFL